MFITHELKYQIYVEEPKRKNRDGKEESAKFGGPLRARWEAGISASGELFLRVLSGEQCIRFLVLDENLKNPKGYMSVISLTLPSKPFLWQWFSAGSIQFVVSINHCYINKLFKSFCYLLFHRQWRSANVNPKLTMSLVISTERFWVLDIQLSAIQKSFMRIRTNFVVSWVKLSTVRGDETLLSLMYLIQEFKNGIFRF